MAHLLTALWAEIRRISRDTTPRYAVGGAVADGADGNGRLWFALAVLMMLMGIVLAWWAVRL